MSAIAMCKKCANCGKKFIYNPSVGDMGFICPHCGKPADTKFSAKKKKTDNSSENDED